MLHLRRAGLLDLKAMTVSGRTLGENLDEWEGSERRAKLRATHKDRNGIDRTTSSSRPMKRAGVASRPPLCFPHRQPAPEVRW
jgi:dihydroxyacid dehydratase/phosphogluconate dehydratase